MLDVRSRAGIVAVTTGAALLLALPVVAAGQAPNAGELVGGVKEKAGNAAPAPPVQLPKPPVKLPVQAQAPAPRRKGQGSPPAQTPAAPPASKPPSAPPAHGRSKKPTIAGGGGKPPASAPRSEPAPAASEGGGSSGGSGDGGSKDGGSEAGDVRGGKVTNVSQDDGGAPTDVQIADQVVETPADANPSTLPFTGFQLALMVALGLAAVAAGVALRRGARSAG